MVHPDFYVVVVYGGTSRRDVPAKFFRFNDADLREGFKVEERLVDAEFAKEDGGIYPDPPRHGGCFLIGRSLFILGGSFFNPYRFEHTYPNLMWSIYPRAGAPATWRIRTSVSNPKTPVRGHLPLAIPYEDRLYVLGGHMEHLRDVQECPPRFMDVYDTSKEPFQLLRSLLLPPWLNNTEILPGSYFLWKKEEEEKTLIMVDFGSHRAGEPRQLVSYDVSKDTWEVFDSNFPVFTGGASRSLVPFDNDTIIIIDDLDIWHLYSLCCKRVIKTEYYRKNSTGVSGVMCCFYRSGPGWLDLYLFMQKRDPQDVSRTIDVPYAKFLLEWKRLSYGISRDLYYRGTIRTGAYSEIYIFGDM